MGRLIKTLMLLLAITGPFWVSLLLAVSFGKAQRAPNADAYVLTPPARNKNELAPQAIAGPRAGDVQILSSFSVVKHASIRRALMRFEPASRVVVFSLKPTNVITFVAAPGLGARLDVLNAFLLARVPYTVSQAWMPLYAVAEHMRYQLDHVQFPGREEVWLTPTQAWSRARGDCEDHALLLADWLIDLGFDARVVLGRHRKDGHAWVVVFKDGKEYLLEATLKQKLKRWSAYPLAHMLPEYHPEMMFNREFIWVNAGSDLTVSYSGPLWRQATRFLPTEI